MPSPVFEVVRKIRAATVAQNPWKRMHFDFSITGKYEVVFRHDDDAAPVA